MTTELTEAMSELDSLLQILEAKLPGNVDAPENRKLVQSLEGDMAEYFRQVEMAIPLNDLEQLYYKLVKQG